MPKKKEKPKKIMSDVPRKVGRPTIYTQELADRICEVIATHPMGIKKICEMYDWMPDQSTIRQWDWKNEEFSTQYRKAKLQQANAYAEDCLDIADDSGFDAYINENGKVVCDSEAINRARLRIDTRRWMAGKLLPKIYGDLIKEADNDADELRMEMRELRKTLDEQNKKEY